MLLHLTVEDENLSIAGCVHLEAEIGATAMYQLDVKPGGIDNSRGCADIQLGEVKPPEDRGESIENLLLLGVEWPRYVPDPFRHTTASHSTPTRT